MWNMKWSCLLFTKLYPRSVCRKYVCQKLNDIFNCVRSKKRKFYRRIIIMILFLHRFWVKVNRLIVVLATISNILRCMCDIIVIRAQLCISNANCQHPRELLWFSYRINRIDLWTWAMFKQVFFCSYSIVQLFIVVAVL